MTDYTFFLCVGFLNWPKRLFYEKMTNDYIWNATESYLSIHFDFSEVMDIYFYSQRKGFFLCPKNINDRLTEKSKFLLDESDY